MKQFLLCFWRLASIQEDRKKETLSERWLETTGGSVNGYLVEWKIFPKGTADTLPETNIAPESLGLEDEFPFWAGLFSGAILALGRVVSEGNRNFERTEPHYLLGEYIYPP